MFFWRAFHFSVFYFHIQAAEKNNKIFLNVKIRMWRILAVSGPFVSKILYFLDRRTRDAILSCACQGNKRVNTTKLLVHKTRSVIERDRKRLLAIDSEIKIIKTKLIRGGKHGRFGVDT